MTGAGGAEAEEEDGGDDAGFAGGLNVRFGDCPWPSVFRRVSTRASKEAVRVRWCVGGMSRVEDRASMSRLPVDDGEEGVFVWPTVGL